MEKPWMPVVAGILEIISGAFGIVVGLFIALQLNIAKAIQGAPGFMPHTGSFPQMPFSLFPGMGMAMGIIIAVIGALAIIGGIFALKTRVWGLALAGSIAAVLTGRIMGVLALIFIVLGRKDFR